MMTHCRWLLVAGAESPQGLAWPGGASGTPDPASSAVAPDAIDVEGPLRGDRVRADEALGARPGAPMLQLAQQVVLVRPPFAVVALEDDHVVDPTVLQELRIGRDVGPAVAGDALGEELGVEPPVVLHDLVHADLAVVGPKDAVGRARYELVRPDERQQLGVGLPVQPTP